MLFSFPHSHAFQGGHVAIEDDGKSGSECLIEFADGVTVVGQWRAEGDAIRLSVPDYLTAKGTLVHARTWRLTQGEDDLWRSERVS
ncbi:hypothetical protein [Brevundimonas naejangsanensis]|uniref:hypothetical protein n=1 Tax=Brevundimonas naejangsanensis TaxID=588932 RepID=UPI00320BB438